MIAMSRKGFNRAADIPDYVLQALSRGEIQTATLAECMALDQALLVRTVFPELSSASLKAVDEACQQLGILKRMNRIGVILLEELSTAGIDRCLSHRVDTVRGWACFMIGAQDDLSNKTRLTRIRPLADDMHFGVREWSWMAVRPHLVRKLDEAINYLSKWTTESSANLRRFASEALRPRGVWCSHIVELKREPEKALPILSALYADPSPYVQDSVANWLNDAAKDKPEWVRNLCGQWLQGEPVDATRRICQRALRNLK